MMVQFKRLIIFALLICGLSAFAAEKRPTAGMIEDMRYLPNKDANELIIEYQGGANFTLQKKEATKQALLIIEGLSFPGMLTRRMDVSAIPGPVVEITPYNSGGETPGAKLLIQLRQNIEIVEEKGINEYKLFFISNDQPKIEKKFRKAWIRRPGRKNILATDVVKIRSGAEDKSIEVADELIKTLQTPSETRVYKGTKISLESEDVSVHDVFRLVGSASGLNIITTSEVSGNINLSLKDVPWDQLLDIVLQEKQLRATNSGNVIRITTIDNYNREQDAKLKMKVTEKKIETVMMAIIPINYAKAEDIKTSISSLLMGAISDANSTITSASPSAAGGSGVATAAAAAVAPIVNTASASSPEDAVQAFVRGKIEVDSRTNSLLVTHTAEQIKRIRALVKELDVLTPQVLIESKIVQANDQFARNLGVDWGGFFQGGPPGAVNPQAGGGGFAVNNFDSGSSFSIVNTSTTGSGVFGMRLGSSTRAHLDMLVSLAEVNSQAKVMASPRLIVNNKQSANISDGTKIAVVTTTSTGSGSNNTTEFVSATLAMQVTPQITNSGQVLMDLQVNQDSPVTAGNLRDIQTKSIKTQVLVETGSTLVLGGVYTYNLNKSDDGVPWLKDLPILGQLFRKNLDNQTRSELLIFVTPRILEVSTSEEEESVDEGVTL